MPPACPVHSDAVQAFGSVPVDFRASGLDAMSISGHKIGGPVGVGALLLGRAVKLTPVQHGGGQERDVRSGTLDTASIAAFAAAAEAATGTSGRGGRPDRALRDRLIDGVLRGRSRRPCCAGRPGTAGCPATRTSPFPAARATRCCSCWTLPAWNPPPAPPARPACRGPPTCCSPWAWTRRPRGAPSVSPWATPPAEADVDALLAALPGAYARARQAGMAGHESSIQTAGTVARQAARKPARLGLRQELIQRRRPDPPSGPG